MNESNHNEPIRVVVLVSAHSEWLAVKTHFHEPAVESSPFGEYFYAPIAGVSCVLCHGGWGKVSASASTQYVIDRWHPRLVLNIGTCGGFEGNIKVGEVLLANETLIYDIHERMGDPEDALRSYTTRIDLSYLRKPFPLAVRVGRLVSADEDIDPGMVTRLRLEYGAVAADWESGAIAWTANRNHTRVLILRVVSDLVSEQAGELYEGGDFTSRAGEVMQPLLRALPDWIDCATHDG